jgi:hypothetical protein
MDLRKILPTLLVMTWALWLGGLATLFIAVTSLFATFDADHTLAGLAASGIFARFNRYQLLLAAVSLIGSFVWRITSKRSGVTGLFFCFGLAAFAAIVVAGIITPHLEAMRLAQKTHTPEFGRLHGISMMLYFFEMVSLVGSGVLFPILIRPVAQDGSSRG